MAEFQEVMKQWRRFCKSHSNCGDCEFDGKGICGEAHLSDVPYSDMELRIMAWAAEHPEPVYPTWRDALLERGLLCIKIDNKGGSEIVPNWPQMAKHIPADIAQKLGIEPKAVNTAKLIFDLKNNPPKEG